MPSTWKETICSLSGCSLAAIADAEYCLSGAFYARSAAIFGCLATVLHAVETIRHLARSSPADARQAINWQSAAFSIGAFAALFRATVDACFGAVLDPIFARRRGALLHDADAGRAIMTYKARGALFAGYA